MDTYTATGVALSVHKFGDTGRVVTFFTRERGKVEASARGIGKPGSKLAAAVEPFTVSRLQLLAGRDLDKLTQAEVVEAFLPLRSDLTRYAYGAALLELTDLTTEPGQAVPGLFEELVAGLAALVTGEEPERLFWAFALRLLGSEGSAPVTEGCVHCGGKLTSRVCYLPGEGGFACSECRPAGEGQLVVSGATVGALHALTRLPLERIERLVMTPEVRRDVNRIVRTHLAHHGAGELRSLKFLDKLNRG